MQLLNLDEATRKGLNELTAEEVSRSVSYAYQHEILGYGIDAVVHTYLMRMARNISEGKLSKEEFAKKYNLELGNQYGLIVSLKQIEFKGIFIPQQAYWDRDDRKIHFFNPDLGNRVYHDSWIDKDYALQLIDKKWQLSDLENPKLVEQGIKFGRDMWRTCVEGFNRTKREYSQPQKITNLGEKLIEYYSVLVSEPTLSK